MQSANGTYTARYDASGNMVCRAPNSSTSCGGGTTTGQQLTYDNEGRLVAFEAVLGLIIEISFIATFTQRFFGSK